MHLEENTIYNYLLCKEHDFYIRVRVCVLTVRSIYIYKDFRLTVFNIF